MLVPKSLLINRADIYVAQEGACTKCILLQTIQTGCPCERIIIRGNRQLSMEMDNCSFARTIYSFQLTIIRSHGQLFVAMCKTYFKIVTSRALGKIRGSLSYMAQIFETIRSRGQLICCYGQLFVSTDNFSFPWKTIRSRGQLDVCGSEQ